MVRYDIGACSTLGGYSDMEVSHDGEYVLYEEALKIIDGLVRGQAELHRKINLLEGQVELLQNVVDKP